MVATLSWYQIIHFEVKNKLFFWCHIKMCNKIYGRGGMTYKIANALL